MKIAFYIAKNGDLWDKLIAFWTRPNFWSLKPAQYSHVEYVFEDGRCFSSSYRDGGVRFKNIDLKPENWDVFQLGKKVDENVIVHTFEKEVGKGYDKLCIFFTFLIPFEIQDPKRWMCSEIIASLVFNMKKAFKISPQGLYNKLNAYYILSLTNK